MSTAFRMLLGVVCILFSMGWAALLVWNKQPARVPDAAVIITFLLVGVAFFYPPTVTFLATTLRPLVPWAARIENHSDEHSSHGPL